MSATHAKLLGSLILCCVFFPVLFTMSHFDDFPAVADDICYLRQAHLFQRFGISGLNTDIQLDDDGYFSDLLERKRIKETPCHHDMPATGKVAMQYPPGTGFILSLFPGGMRRASLFGASTIVIASLLFSALWRSRSYGEIFAWTVFGSLTLYFMINPTISSDSLPPTMAICALVGALTPHLFAHSTYNKMLVIAATIGLLLGISVDVRLANTFLAVGYFTCLLYAAIKRFDLEALALLSCFTAGFIFGVLPTFLANYINVGSPFKTTYTGADTALPQFDFGEVAQTLLYYGRPSNQGLVLWTAVIITVFLHRIAGPSLPGRRIQLIVYTNMIVNLGYYVTHPIRTPYYAMPFAMLTLWIALSSQRSWMKPFPEHRPLNTRLSV
jgi:hypothetical protein